MHEKAMIFDLFLESLSNTAIDVINAMTRAIRAIKVIVLIMALYPLKKKQSPVRRATVTRYFIAPMLLKMTGTSRADHITPIKAHLAISHIKSILIFILHL